MCTVFCHQQCHYVMIGSAGSRRAGARSEERRGLVAVRGGDGEKKRREYASCTGDRGGCPVFRVTWLNGIALAHSCPLRRDGRLASRFFSPPLRSPPRSAPLHASFSFASRSCFACKRSRKRSVVFFFLFFFFSDAAANGARLVL